MSSFRKPRSLILPLLVVVMVAPPVAFAAALPWLKQQPVELALFLTGVVSLLTVLSSIALAILHDRKIDEWQRANARFASQWGWSVGGCLFALLLALPPVRELIVAGAAIWGGTPDPDARLVVTTFTFGFMSVIAAQVLCTVLLSVGWHLWMSRGPRERS